MVNVLKPALLETEMCGKRVHGKTLQWYKTTGDISNCYDELRHDRIVAAVKFWIHQIPILLGSRSLDRFSICKWNRKICVRGNDNTGGDYVTITITMLMSVVQFDCENSILNVRGKLYKRKLGAPMGGFLSAFYAMLCFAHREFVTLFPRFKALGMIGWIGRDLDDVLIMS